MFRRHRHRHEFFWTTEAMARCYICGEDVEVPQVIIDRMKQIQEGAREIRRGNIRTRQRDFRKAKQRARARKLAA